LNLIPKGVKAIPSRARGALLSLAIFSVTFFALTFRAERGEELEVPS
jgi:hypothetical protein